MKLAIACFILVVASPQGYLGYAPCQTKMIIDCKANCADNGRYLKCESQVDDKCRSLIKCRAFCFSEKGEFGKCVHDHMATGNTQKPVHCQAALYSCERKCVKISREHIFNCKAGTV